MDFSHFLDYSLMLQVWVELFEKLLIRGFLHRSLQLKAKGDKLLHSQPDDGHDGAQYF